MKKTLLASILLATTFQASAEVSVEVGVASDYRFNGISMSDKDPVVNGSVNYVHQKGWYVGTEATSTGDTDVVDAEVDVFFGKKHTFQNDVTLDVQLRTSTFHGSSMADEFNYTELTTAFLKDGLEVSFTYTNDMLGTDLNDLKTRLAYTEAVGSGFLTFDFAHIHNEDKLYFGEDSYVTYGVKYLQPVTEDLEFSVRAMGTNIDDDVDVDRIAQETVVAEINWKF